MKDPTTFTENDSTNFGPIRPDFSPAQSIRHVACGFLMGGADVIPGVSGGTIALVLGIYERLVTAISRCDFNLLTLVKEKRWRDAFGHLDLGFLMTLGLGILLGVVTLGGLMNGLLSGKSTRMFALSALFGLILASAYVVGKLVSKEQPASRWSLVLAGIVGALFAAWVSGLTAGPPNTSLWFIFCSGAIAICAMILPGISGAYILLILGLYGHITEILKALPKGQVTWPQVVDVGVFVMGCGLGLIVFSKFLRWLLRRYHSITMAVLCGFMVGALPKVWPFQRDLTPEVEKLSHKHFELDLPSLFDRNVWICGGIALLFFVAVVSLNAIANKAPQTSEPDPRDS